MAENVKITSPKLLLQTFLNANTEVKLTINVPLFKKKWDIMVILRDYYF